MHFWLANLVVVVHAAAIFINVAGMLGLVTGRWKLDSSWTRRHTAFTSVAVGTLASLAIHGRCVLTTWENRLRELDRSGSSYGGPFIAEYAPFVPPVVARYSVFLLVGAAISGAVYWRTVDVVRRRRLTVERVPTAPAGPVGQPAPDDRHAEPGAAADGGRKAGSRC